MVKRYMFSESNYCLVFIRKNKHKYKPLISFITSIISTSFDIKIQLLLPRNLPTNPALWTLL